MSVIVCATGNGDRSRFVQARAVEVARLQRKPLVFVHVVDLRQLGELDESLVGAATSELAWLGDAILRLARDRARRQGVQAEGVVLYGEVWSALEDYLKSQPVDRLLMGAATSEVFESFARHVENELGVPVHIVAAE